MPDFDLPQEWLHLADGADHLDVKTGQGPLSVRAMSAGILAYRPGWIAALWRLRACLVRLLGLGPQQGDGDIRLTAETLPVQPGRKVGFFTVVDSDGETFWIVEGVESHLRAALAVFAEPVAGSPGVNHFRVATVVHYLSRVGPIYFNLIRPFHHLVVRCAMNDAIRKAGSGK